MHWQTFSTDDELHGVWMIDQDGNALLARIRDLESQVERYEAVLSSNGNFAIIATDLAGIVTEWNAGAEDVLGWQAFEMVGKSAEVLFTPEDRLAGVADAEMAGAVAHGQVKAERWHLRKDGSRVWASIAFRPLNDTQGRHAGFLRILRDHSTQHLAGEALKQAESSELRYRTLLSSMSVGFCVLEMIFDDAGIARDYRFLETNEAFEVNTGLRQAEGRTAKDLVPGLEQAWVDVYAEVAITGRPKQFESGSDAMGRWFDVFAIPIDEPGKHRVALIFHDLTERHKAEAALRESEGRFRNVADHSPLMMWVTDPAGQATYLNRAWYDFTGQREEAALGLGWLDAVHDDDKGWSGEEFMKANAQRAAFRLEYRLRNRSGEYRWAIDAASPRFDDDGAFLGYVGSVMDIHDQKKAQEALRSQNAQLQSVVSARTTERDRLWDNSADLVGIAGLDGYLKSINPAWTRMLGWSEAELLAKPFAAIIDPVDHAETTDVIARLSAGETVTGFIDHLYDNQGNVHTIMWTAVPDPGTERFHIIGRDLTEQLRIQDQLRQSQKMEAVGQLTGGLAHDFNNLLTGIIGSLELMGNRIAQGRLGEIERYATAAQGAAKRAAALTHRLLAFSRRQTLDPRPTDVNRLITGMEEMVRRTVGPEIEVEVVASAGLWPTLVDPNQLENALLNLCINARDAMPEGGRITIETGNRWLDQRTARERDMVPGQYISLCVSDTGTGMTPDVIAKAFDPFFTTKPIGMGTGLGLSMIYGFARQSGGHVRIYSEVGDGAMVCIYLPRHLGEADVPPAPSDLSIAPRAEAGETVLVVDDEPSVRMLVTEVLEDLGYAAIEAGDASAGLSILESDVRIDLLVTDVGLPGGMNGRQMADAARRTRPNLKVLFITGYAENAVVGNGQLDHGMHVMTKPFPMDVLANRIKKLISER